MYRQLLFAAWWIGLYVLLATAVSSQSELSQEALSMLHDPLGWQYAGVGERKDVKEVLHLTTKDNRSPTSVMAT
jgi:hypothetical protein